jgi:hypothetical protein
MSIDKRELILARLPLFAASTLGFEARRNDNDFSDVARPLAVTLDGDEEADENDPVTRPPDAPRRITVKGQIVVLASGPADTIGTTMNGYRVKLIKGIVADATLLGLVLNGRDRQSIRYEGGTLAITSGRAIEAELRLDFAFTYLLRFDEL